MQLITGSELNNDSIDNKGGEFTVSGAFAVIVDAGSVVLEIKIGGEFYAITEPTDQYYRALVMTGSKSVRMFAVPEDNSIYRLRGVSLGMGQTTDYSARAYSIALNAGVTWQP